MNSLKTYQPKKYDHLIGMPGFSEKLLTTHFKLYEGYVTNTNKALEELKALREQDKGKTHEFAEIKRRLGWEFNGMRLHEYYFDNLGGKDALNPHSPLSRMFESQYGSFDAWKKDFTSTGAMRGIGWVVLYLDAQSNRFMNIWVEEHNANHLIGGDPILILDVFEHAYMADYGTDKEKYMTAFFKNINWDLVSDRCQKSLPAEAVTA